MLTSKSGWDQGQAEDEHGDANSLAVHHDGVKSLIPAILGDV